MSRPSCAQQRGRLLLSTAPPLPFRSRSVTSESIKENTRRLYYLDDQERKANLRFCGVGEHRNENQEQTMKKNQANLSERLNIASKLEFSFRIGKTSSKPSRDILIGFHKIAERDALLTKRISMKGTNIY